MTNINTLLEGHVTLKCECMDRIFLNGYVAQLQTGEQVSAFFRFHRKKPILSGTLLDQMSNAFVKGIKEFAESEEIPLVRFEKGQRKEDVARPYQEKARQEGRSGVVVIGVAQEKHKAVEIRNAGRNEKGIPQFSFHRDKRSGRSVFVNYYYFYFWDEDFGPCFIRFCSYMPFSVRVGVNGHEWVKRQLERFEMGYESLGNGFLKVADPECLQKLCDALGASQIETWFRSWLRRLPHPFTAQDREAGYRYQLSVLQVEFSLTQVFERPVQGREFFEAVIRENLDLGRPDQVQLIFGRRVQRNTPSRFRTRVLTQGVTPSLHADYKNSRVKQYFKENRALRTETTINNTYDFGVGRRLEQLASLQKIGRHINHQVLENERVSQDCTLEVDTLHRLIFPRQESGQRIPALRWGDPRVLALLSALTHWSCCWEGFSNAHLRPLVATLWGQGRDYSSHQMTYDLRRLRLHGLMERIPSTHRYRSTAKGRRVALAFTKIYSRVFRSVSESLDPQVPSVRDGRLKKAWREIDSALDEHVRLAQLCA